MSIWKKRIYPGIITAVLLTAVALWFKSGAIERDLVQRTQSVVGEWANITVDGRDILIEGVVSDDAELGAALKKAASTHGVRILKSDIDMVSKQEADAQSVADAENEAAQKAADEAAIKAAEAEMAAKKAAEEALKAENEEAKIIAEKAAEEAAEKMIEAETAEVEADKDAEAKEVAATEADEKADEANADEMTEKDAAANAAAEDELLSQKGNLDEDDSKAKAKALELAILVEKEANKSKSAGQSDALLVNPQYYIVVKKNQTGLEISGLASSEEIRAQLINEVKAKSPNVDIDETLVIDDELGSKFQDTVAFGMKQLERLDEGQFTIESDSFSIIGNAKSLDNYEAFYNALKDGDVADLNIAKVNVKAPKISPYLFAIDYDGDVVHLTGFVPNEQAKDEVKAIMQTTYPGIQTTENLQIASGEPANFLARVRQAAAKLSLVPKGIATMTDAEVKLEDASGAPIKADAVKEKVKVEKQTTTETSKKVEEKKVVKKKKPARKFKLAENQTCQELFDQLLSTRQVIFKPGKAVITSESLPVLKTLVRIAERCPSALLQISGHTDSDGSKAANQSLSLARAKAVRSYLFKNGISGKRLLAIGYGEKRPIASNSTAKGKQKNRRIEFYVIEQ